MAFNRPCIVCGTLTRSSRCPEHQAQLDLIKQTKRETNPDYRAKKNALYNSDYRRRAKWIRATATTCHLCGQPFQPGDTIEADHIEAGNPNSQLAPAHRLCNQRRGATPLPPAPPAPPVSA